jgi:hypothetical protein
MLGFPKDELEGHLIFARNSRFSLTTCKDQHLIYSVHFIANIASDWNLHRHELAEQSSVQHFPELPESSHFGSELGEVDHLMLRRRGRHLRIFALEYGCCGK